MKIARQWTGLHLAVLGAVALLFMAGCTLSGSSGLGDVTPVSDTGGADEVPTVEVLTATPTTEVPELSDLEVLGTQAAVTATAQAAGAASEETLGETTDEGTGETEEGAIISDDAGGEIAPPTNTPVGTPLAAEAVSCPSTHTVAGGENLYRIALRYGLTYQELAAANGIANPAQISTGLVLTIPCGQAAATDTAATGTAATDQTAAAATSGTHTVAAGENLYRIALRYNMTWTTLAAANGITNPDFIVVGQVLQIPQ